MREWESRHELGIGIRDLCGSQGKPVSLPFCYVASSYCLLKVSPSTLILYPSAIPVPRPYHTFFNLCQECVLAYSVPAAYYLAFKFQFRFCLFCKTCVPSSRLCLLSWGGPHCPIYISHHAKMGWSVLYLRCVHVDMCSVFIFTAVQYSIE